MLGLEQYLVILIGIALHILVKLQLWQKGKGKHTWEQWQKDNLVPTAISILSALGAIFIMKGFFELGLVPAGFTNLICGVVGYMSDSVWKNLMAKGKNKIDKI